MTIKFLNLESKYSLLSVGSYSTFEVQLFKTELSHPVFCTLIFRPPKYSKDFLQDFSYLSAFNGAPFSSVKHRPLKLPCSQIISPSDFTSLMFKLLRVE